MANETKKGKKQNDEDFIKRICDPCKFENKTNTANAYCQPCREYLCAKCEKFHKKFQATRAHKIVHGVLMPKPVKKSMSTCENHENNAIEYYCQYHTDVICGDCKDIKHSLCEHVLPIDIASSKEIEKEHLEEAKSKLENLNNAFESFLEVRKSDVAKLQEEKMKVQNSIAKTRRDFNTLLDRLETDINKELDEIHGYEQMVLTDQIKVCEPVVSSLNAALENLAHVKKTENNMALFVTFSRALKKARDFEKVMKEVKREAYTVKLEFEPNETITDALNEGFESFGKTEITVIQKTFPNKLSDLKKEYMKAVDTQVYSVRMDGDDEEHDCEITGSTFLTDGSLVICDRHNSKVKHLDPSFNCKSDIKLSGAPWDVAVVNDYWVVATLPFVHKVQFLHADINEGLRPGRFIQTDRMCWGIAVANDDIIITCHDNPGNGKIHILDKRGHTKKIIGAESEGTSYMLELPLYIATNTTGDKLFVADGDTKKIITCLMKKGGQIVYDYSACGFGYSKASNDKTYHNPWSFKILVDEDDYVFANIGDKEMIQIVSDMGIKHRTFLTTKQELFGPHTMSYRELDSTLVISLWDQIQTFRFKEIEPRI